nr:MAG TPA: hypothetical protein [Caudoviricetes sp.]
MRVTDVRQPIVVLGGIYPQERVAVRNNESVSFITMLYSEKPSSLMAVSYHEYGPIVAGEPGYERTAWDAGYIYRIPLNQEQWDFVEILFDFDDWLPEYTDQRDNVDMEVSKAFEDDWKLHFKVRPHLTKKLDKARDLPFAVRYSSLDGMLSSIVATGTIVIYNQDAPWKP